MGLPLLTNKNENFTYCTHLQDRQVFLESLAPEYRYGLSHQRARRVDRSVASRQACAAVTAAWDPREPFNPLGRNGEDSVNSVKARTLITRERAGDGSQVRGFRSSEMAFVCGY